MKLTIPENISLEWELIHGIGKREIRLCLTVMIPALIIALLLGKILTSPIAPLALIMAYILVCATCIMFFAKIDQGQSAYLFILRIIQYQREQQKFYFKRREEELDESSIG